jgi:hypothetical protein
MRCDATRRSLETLIMKRSLTFAFALLVCACGTDEPAGGIGGNAGTGGSGASGGSGGSGGEDAGPGITRLRAGWNTLAPGGPTTCSRGTPFQYFVRPGTVNRVVIDFRGGGACWDELTCSARGAIFEETAEADAFIADESVATGIYDHQNPLNPFKDWHHVYIPYCTGDVHWGDAERTYGTGDQAFTIRHKGGVNARAVLDWVYENVPRPEKVFVTGCSAGAYGAIMWSAHLRNHYGSAKVYQFADSGAGVITDTFFQESFPQWNAQASYPMFIPNVDPADFTRLPQLYELIGKTYVDMFLSQYNTNYDENQHFYYRAMGGGDAFEWSQKMRAHISEIERTTPNFASYIAPDSQHCIVPYENFYSVESGGVRLVDWLTDVVADEAVESVQCDPNCGVPLAE